MRPEGRNARSAVTRATPNCPKTNFCKTTLDAESTTLAIASQTSPIAKQEHRLESGLHVGQADAPQPLIHCHFSPKAQQCITNNHPCIAFNHSVTIASYIKALHANSLRTNRHMCSANLAPVRQMVVVTSNTAVCSGRLTTNTPRQRPSSNNTNGTITMS